jgi:PTS system mannose-specific IIA component
MIRILIITHGELGKELVKTAEIIVGKQEEVEVLGLTQQDSLVSMCKRTGEILDKMNSTDGTLILTDMLGGTPCNSSLPFSTSHKIEIISGVNLYMMLSSFLNRNTMKLEDLAQKVLMDGQKNIANAKEIFLKKLK